MVAKKGREGCHNGCPLLQATWLATDAKQEAEAQVRKLKEDLRLEKNVCLATTLLALGLVGMVREQDIKLESLMCHFANLGDFKLPWNKF